MYSYYKILQQIFYYIDLQVLITHKNMFFKIMSYIITLICVLSNDSIGFPYNEDPTSPKQKRLVILKTEREFIDSYARKESIENTISAKDSGFYIIR